MLIISAFLAGILSVFSPCVFPMIPVFIGSVASENPLRNSILFCIGMTATFVTLGMGVTAIGSILINNELIISDVANLIILIFGLHMINVIRIPMLEAQYTVQANSIILGDFFRPLLVGGLFSFGWSPCVGPILGSVLTMAGSTGTVWYGGLLLFIYSLGLSLPFIIVGAGFLHVKTLNSKYGQYYWILEYVGGVSLILFALWRFYVEKTLH